MKRYLTYPEFAKVLDEIILKVKDEGFQEIIPVVRGGLSAAHYIAKELRLPCGAFWPDLGGVPFLLVTNRHHKKILFVEDLVAKGRTYYTIQREMTDNHPEFEWEFAPVLVDSSFPIQFKYEGFRSEDWIVFPYEEMSKMNEGDRGLFRERTDNYGN